MPEPVAPATPEELREALRHCSAEQTRIETGGSFSKRLAGGPIAAAPCRLETTRLDRLLAYEPADLTVSVQAGMRYSELARTLAKSNQFLPLDPPFLETATIGGILAANASGPRRRRYGTARDMVIGMRFATLDGRLVSSGGMVVKNVTGLDMGKLMIGSFGTLAVIVSANFKVFPRPESRVSFVFHSGSVETLLAVRRDILGSALQPDAIDWLDPAAAELAGLPPTHAMLIEVSGSPAVMRRYEETYRSLASWSGVESELLSQDTWDRVGECGPRWLQRHPAGALIRVSTVHSRLGRLLDLTGRVGCATALRAGNAQGLCLAPDGETAGAALDALRGDGFHATLEAAQDDVKGKLVQWDIGGSEFQLMQRLKADFDPLMLLNPGRLYGRI